MDIIGSNRNTTFILSNGLDGALKLLFSSWHWHSTRGMYGVCFVTVDFSQVCKKMLDIYYIWCGVTSLVVGGGCRDRVSYRWHVGKKSVESQPLKKWEPSHGSMEKLFPRELAGFTKLWIYPVKDLAAMIHQRVFNIIQAVSSPHGNNGLLCWWKSVGLMSDVECERQARALPVPFSRHYSRLIMKNSVTFSSSECFWFIP